MESKIVNSADGVIDPPVATATIKMWVTWVYQTLQTLVRGPYIPVDSPLIKSPLPSPRELTNLKSGVGSKNQKAGTSLSV